MTSLAGGGTTGFDSGFDLMLTGTAALFQGPAGIATNASSESGNVYVADSGNHRVNVVTPDGVVVTLAGGGADSQTYGADDGVGTAALFYTPYGVAVDASLNVFVADTGKCVRDVG